MKKEYKNYVKILDKLIKDAKTKHDKEIIQRNSDNPKQIWSIINSKIGNKNKTYSQVNEIINENNVTIKDQTQIANIINDHYCNIGKKMSNKIVVPNNKKIELPNMNVNSIFIKPTDVFEIKNIIENLKLRNGGVDKINSKTLKVISNNISDTLAHIFNKCIEKSIWPDALKTAEVVPIFKSGKKCDIANYRPISLISNIAKIFEKIIHNRILNFIGKNKILSEKQFGFIKKKGTKDALSYITKKIYENLDKSTPIAVAFLDLAKAFDTVDHKILLEKLYAYGIRGNAYKLLESYLTNRKQKVRLGDKESEYNTVNTGVPQGTILGPLLFM